MNSILVTDFPPPRRAFRVVRLPMLARFYRYTFHRQAGSRWGMRRQKVLQKLFPFFRRHWGASTGEFEFTRAGVAKKISFNARNVQFLGVYVTTEGYELEVAALLDTLLPEGGTFYDIGSNWGYFTLYAAACRERLTVHAFEPLHETHQDLVACVEQASLAGHTMCHNVALSDKDGEAHIQIPDGLHSGTATVSSEGIRITTRRLDAMGLPPPNFIKLDAENHEIEVLQGAAETLKKVRPFLVFENKPNYAHPEKDLRVLLFLKELGYQFFVPAVKRNAKPCEHFMQVFWHSLAPGDGLGLIPFEPETRFLYQHELNVFACHKDRLPELREKFKVWPQSLRDFSPAFPQ
jgi:FkbM family methyltransferase